MLPVGHTSPTAPQCLRRSGRERSISQRLTPAVLVGFGVLHAGDEDMRVHALTDRKAWLQRDAIPRPGIPIVDSLATHSEALLPSPSTRQEGILAKRMDSRYEL